MEYNVLSEYSLDQLLKELDESDTSDEFDEETLALLRELELRGWE